jgi:hypothetical protein
LDTGFFSLADCVDSVNLFAGKKLGTVIYGGVQDGSMSCDDADGKIRLF